MSDRTVSVALRAQVDNFVSGMKKSEAVTKQLKKQVEATRRENILMSKAAAMIGGAVAIAAVKKAVDAASNLNETMSKTGVVFGDAAAGVLDWSKTSATALGMSRQQAAEAAASFGNLFVSMKMGQKPAADMSMRLVALASDLASFNNIDPAEALDALRSGLVGETEPLRRLGVNLNDATLKAQALKMGLIQTTTQALEPGAKAQAAYALILEQTTTAQGDFARTAGGLANQQRILNAQWVDAQAGLGQALLPAVTSTVSALNEFLGVFNALPDPVKAVAVATGLLAGGLILLLPRIAATKAAAVELGVTMASVKTAVSSAGSILAGPWGLAITAGIAAISLFATQSDEATGAQDDFKNALEASSGALDENVRKAAAKKAEDMGLLALADDLGIAYSTVIDAILGNAAALDQLRSVTRPATSDVERFQSALTATDTGLQGLQATTSDTTYQTDQLRTGVEGLAGEFATAAGTAGRVSRASDAAASSFGNVADKAGAAADEVKTLKQKIDELRGTQISAEEATSNLEEAIDKATAAAKENGKSLSLNTEAGRANKAALRDVATAALDGVDAWVQNGASAATVATKTQQARDAFIAAAIKMGATKTEAEALADAYGLIPKKVSTTITADGAQAKAEADAVKRHYDSVRTYIAQHPAKYKALLDDGRADGGYISGYAFGGRVSGPGTGRSDSINARLSNGEYVVNAAATARSRPILDAINYGRAVPVMAGGAASFSVSAPVQLRLDSSVVWQGLLRLKRGKGGIELGLA